MNDKNIESIKSRLERLFCVEWKEKCDVMEKFLRVRLSLIVVQVFRYRVSKREIVTGLIHLLFWTVVFSEKFM